MIDSTGLNKGIAEAQKYTKRTVPELVNTSAYWVAVNAKAGLPVVTPEKVDTDMGTIISAKIGKRGKALSTRSAKNRIYSASTKRAYAIVMARSRPGSDYNILTGGRYALPSFKGLSAAAIHAKVAELVDKMIKARRRSGSFLVAGWVQVVRKMLPYSVQKFMRGSSPRAGEKAYYGANLGDATPAREGGFQATAVIENDVGMEGKNMASFNRALMTYGEPALQRAVNFEGERQMKYALDKMEKELAAATNRHWA